MSDDRVTDETPQDAVSDPEENVQVSTEGQTESTESEAVETLQEPLGGARTRRETSEFLILANSPYGKAGQTVTLPNSPRVKRSVRRGVLKVL